MQAARGASLNPSGDTTPPDPRATPAARRSRHLALFAAVAVLGLTLDVVTKVLAVERLTDRPPVHVVGDVLTLYLARNPGAAFSSGTSYTLFFTVVAATAAVVVLFYARRLGSTGWALALGFLLAGVLGNLTDRVFRSPGFLRGHVVDFIALPHWPIFNVADMCINVAAGLIILQALRGITLGGTRAPKGGSRTRRGSDDATPSS